MQNYDIRYDDKYDQLAQIDVAAEGAGYEPWVNQTLTSVNDSVVRLAVIEAGAIRPWCAPGRDDPAWRPSPSARARTHGLADGRAGHGDPRPGTIDLGRLKLGV